MVCSIVHWFHQFSYGQSLIIAWPFYSLTHWLTHWFCETWLMWLLNMKIRIQYLMTTKVSLMCSPAGGMKYKIFCPSMNYVLQDKALTKANRSAALLTKSKSKTKTIVQSDLKFDKKFTRPNFQAKEFYTLKTRKSRLFSPAINSENASLSVIWPSFG